MGIQENPTAKPIMHECVDGTIATLMLTVSAAHLRAMQGAHAVDDTRNYLNGIYLDLSEDPAQLVATDGHIMARCPVIYVNRDAIIEFIAERKQVKNADGKAKHSDPDQLVFRLDKRIPQPIAAKVELIGIDLRTRRAWVMQDQNGVGRVKPKPQEWFIAALEDGKYPDWRRVDTHYAGYSFKTARGDFPGFIGIDLRILGRVHEGVTKIEPSAQDVRTYSGRQVVSDGPCRITFIAVSVCDVLVTLMPCRT